MSLMQVNQPAALVQCTYGFCTGKRCFLQRSRMIQDACSVQEDSDLTPYVQTTPVLYQRELLTPAPCLAAPLYRYGKVTSQTRD